MLAVVALAGCGSYDTIRTTPQSLSPSGSGELRSFTQGPDVAVQAAAAKPRQSGGSDHTRNADVYQRSFQAALSVNTAR